jgi:acyl-CoA thioester hydrolase
LSEPSLLTLDVRDYECDFQGIVNHSVYLNYLEHARHLFLRGRGMDFVELSRRGINLVIIRAEVDYKLSLRSGDRFTVATSLERVSPLRFAFRQRITREPDGRPVLEARITGTSVDARGRPHLPADVEAFLARHAAPAGGPADRTTF